MHGNSKPGWLPNVPYVDIVFLYLNCDLEGMNEREMKQQTSGVCAPMRTMPVKGLPGTALPEQSPFK